MIAQIFFYLSLVGIIGMLSFKVVEDMLGGVHWWSRVIESADTRIHEGMRVVSKKYRLWKRIASLFFFEFLPAYAYGQVVKLKDYLHKKYYASQTNLRGSKRMLRSNGSVSEFLQHISKEDGVVQADETTDELK